jgi:hypothetical protein
MEGKVQIHSEKNVTVNDLVSEARIIFDKIKSGIAFNDIETSHRQFCTSYPIVVRYMYETGTYREKAFRQMLRNMSLNPQQSEEQYLDNQSKYVTTLYRMTNPRASPKDISRLRDETMKSLHREHESFKKEAGEAKELVEHKIQDMTNARADILKSLTSALPDRDLIIVESDPSVSTGGCRELQLPVVDLQLPTSSDLLND